MSRPARTRPVANGPGVWRWALGLALVPIAVAAALPPGAEARGYRTRMRLQMGSLTEITVPESAYRSEVVNRAFDVVQRLDALLSTYKADSEVSRLAQLGHLRVSPEVMALTAESLRLARLTDGAFNPLLGPVIALWREAADADRPPSPEALARARALADIERVTLDLERSEIRFAERGMGLNFGAIGKGYAVDRAAESLIADGIRTALVSSGTSSHRLVGRPAGQTCWELGIRHPDDERRAVAVLRLPPGGLATSAQSGQPVEIAGRTYGHIIDARTGRPATPAEPVWSASVIAPRATEADALSTALVVMEAPRGLELIDSLEDVEALLVRRSPEGEPRLQLSRGLERAGEVDGLPLVVPRAAPECLTEGDAAGLPAGRPEFANPAAAAAVAQHLDRP